MKNYEKQIDKKLDSLDADTHLTKTRRAFLILAILPSRINKKYQDRIKDILGFFSEELRQYLVEYYFASIGSYFYHKEIKKAVKQLKYFDKLNLKYNL